jgi:single-strand DNA-binding protein
MNFTVFAGHLTRDPELETTPSGVEYCRFTIGVSRPFKDKNGERGSDFIPCQAWRQTAVFINKFFRKGHPIMVQGSLQSRVYEDQEGKKRSMYTINVEHAMFPPAKKKEDGSGETTANDGYVPPDPPPEGTPGVDDELPF